MARPNEFSLPTQQQALRRQRHKCASAVRPYLPLAMGGVAHTDSAKGHRLTISDM